MIKRLMIKYTVVMVLFVFMGCSCKNNTQSYSEKDKVSQKERTEQSDIGQVPEIDAEEPEVPEIKEIKVNEYLKARVSIGSKTCWIQELTLIENQKKVVIPDEIEGVPVTRLEYVSDGEKSPAYDKDTNIFGVVMGGDDSEPNEDATAPINNACIEEIVLPDSISYIEKTSFAGLLNLRKINIPKGVEELKEYVFLRCERMKRIDIPIGVKKINKRAFDLCKALKRIHIEEENESYIETGDVIMKSDNKTLFMIAKKKKELVLPPNVRSFGRLSLSYLEPKRISVDSQNNFLQSKNNCIFTKKNRELIGIVFDKYGKVFIPNDVKVLGDEIESVGVFSEIYIPKSVRCWKVGWCYGFASKNNVDKYIYIYGDKIPKIKGKYKYTALYSGAYYRMNKCLAKEFRKMIKKYDYKLRWDKKKNAYYAMVHY